jgi:hypothetical protein
VAWRLRTVHVVYTDIMWEVLKVTLMEKRCRSVILNQVIVHKFERINRITVGNQEFEWRGKFNE